MTLSTWWRGSKNSITWRKRNSLLTCCNHKFILKRFLYVKYRKKGRKVASVVQLMVRYHHSIIHQVKLKWPNSYSKKTIHKMIYRRFPYLKYKKKENYNPWREWGEWPSGLRHCDWNRKIPRSNPTRQLARPKDPISLQGSWWPLCRKS